MLSSTELQTVAENTSYSIREVLLAILKSKFDDASTLGGLNEAIVMLNKWKVTNNQTVS